MDYIWLLILFGAATAYFGAKVLQTAPTFFKLLEALVTGTVKWPGPRIHDPDRNTSIIREHLGILYENLFPTFILNALGVLGALVFSLLTLISSTPLMRHHIWIDWNLTTILLTLFAFIGGEISFKKAQQNMVQVNAFLSDIARKVEPRAADGQSARSEYAIEHPLIGVQNLPYDRKRALNQFYESVRWHQDGNELKASALYNEATSTDPSLHENAREALSNMAQSCSSTDAGAIYYWLGLHSVYLSDLRQAAIFYKKAVNAFEQIGYKKRASRACNNLGSVKMQMRDPSAMEEFEKAIVLDPTNGMAHISIGVTYYRISDRGDPWFEPALDAFANAIAVDPATYTPVVLSHLRSIGYTWKEDWEDIARRVVSRQTGISVESDGPTKSSDELQGYPKKRIGFETNKNTILIEKPKKTHRNEKYGFEIDLPEECRSSSIQREGPKEYMQYGCHEEAFNFEAAPLFPEPRLDQTEHDFVQFAVFRGFTRVKFGRITIRGKEHVCVSYHASDVMGERWNKKYMIVFDGTEYTITAICNDAKWFEQREKDWDAIVRSFRLLDDST